MGGLEQRLEPAGARGDVIVQEHHQPARGVSDPRVACDVQAAGMLVGEVARAEALGHLGCLR